MPKRIPRALCLLLCVLLGCLASPVALAREYSGVSRDYAVTGLTSSEARGGRFTVHASFSYYGVSQKYSYTEGGNFYDCGPCKGTGYLTCAACKGEGGKIQRTNVLCQLCHGHSEPYCQRSCDGTDYMCSVCGHLQTSNFGHQNYCNHPWAWYPYADCKCKTNEKADTWVECKVCHGDGMRECPRCHGNGWYETGGHIVTYYPSDPFPQAVTVDFLLDGAVVSSGPLTLAVHTEKNNNQSWEKWAGADAEATISAGVGVHQVEARINWQGRTAEINRNNNSQTISVEVRPVIDLAGEFIPPGANYRAGAEVISTFRIFNRDPEGNGQDVTPADRLRADFSAVNPATGAALTAQTASSIVIPQGGGNIVYFKWRVPEDYPPGPVSLRLQINPDGAVDETNVGNNVIAVSHPVYSLPASVTPGTVLEKKPPSAFSPAIMPPANAQNKMSASWEQWVWRDNGFLKQTNFASLSPTAELSLDKHAGYQSEQDGVPVTRSGYPLNAVVTAGRTDAPAGAVTGVQRCDALFREFNYLRAPGDFQTLDIMTSGANGARFEFGPNRQSFTHCRAHFTPLWTPDGDYVVSFLVTDYWTPAGMLGGYVADHIVIDGSMQDDWYTTRGG